MRLHAIVAITTFLLATGGAFAAEIDIPPPPKAKDPAVQVNQPNCSRWTDDCVTCTRSADGAAPLCSNIGIACQPKAIRCLGTEVETKTPEPAAK